MKFHLSRTLSIASKVLVQVDSTRLSSRTSVYKRVATFDWKRGKGAVTTSRGQSAAGFSREEKNLLSLFKSRGKEREEKNVDASLMVFKYKIQRKIQFPLQLNGIICFVIKSRGSLVE
jgi:hypothetical protein